MQQVVFFSNTASLVTVLVHSLVRFDPMSDQKQANGFGLATNAVHAGQYPDPISGIRFSVTTWAQIVRCCDDPNLIGYYFCATLPRRAHGSFQIISFVFFYDEGYEYSRTGNPTRNALEDCVAALENAKWGTVSSTFRSVSQCRCRICKWIRCYWIFGSAAQERGWSYRLRRFIWWFLPLLHEAVWYILILLINISIIHLKFFTELISNSLTFVIFPLSKRPWLKPLRWFGLRHLPTRTWKLRTSKRFLVSLCFIQVFGGNCIDIAHKVNKDTIVVVDNTFATPFFQNPLNHGADLTYHSVSKYINGHSDVVMGMVCGNDEDLRTRVKFVQNGLGAIPSPFDSFLVLRGLKTLHLRMERHQQNAKELFKLISSHPKGAFLLSHLGSWSDSGKGSLARWWKLSSSRSREEANVWLWWNDYLLVERRHERISPVSRESQGSRVSLLTSFLISGYCLGRVFGWCREFDRAPCHYDPRFCPSWGESEARNFGHHDSFLCGNRISEWLSKWFE